MTQAEQTSEIRVFNQEIEVPFSYPVYFTHSLFSKQNTTLKELITVAGENAAKAAAFIDSGIMETYPEIRDDIRNYFNSFSSQVTLVEAGAVIPGGETAKNGWDHVQSVINTLQQHRLCRHSFVIAIGGGSFLDVVGFGAGIFHRGIRLIRVPTTTLSQDDSGVGVKNGINLGTVKNMVGSFNPPFAVINDFDFLRTLSPELVLDGIAEAFKVAIIKDPEFFSFLSQNAGRIAEMDWAVIEQAVRKSAVIHLKHISTSDDPFEFGISRPLDFGHWSAHMLEGLSDYTVRHGQAVSIGICLDTLYAWKMNMITENEMEQIINAMIGTGLPMCHPLIMQKNDSGEFSIIEGLELFREHLGGKLSVTLPTGLGSSIEVHEIDTAVMKECIDLLKKKADTR